jgi:dihydrofolate reductase
MQPIIYDVAVSADGFIAGASGDVSLFSHTGEVVDDYTARLQTYATVLMGRATYEFGYAFGLEPGRNPYPWAQSLVISKTIELPADAQVEQVTDPLPRIERLRAEAPGPIYLCGGGILAGMLLRAGQITQLRLKRGLRSRCD